MDYYENKTVKHVIFISYDAFSEDNWEKARKLPNLSKLINNGASTNSLSSVYPTLTYVVHSTIVTGVYPDKHGIIHNNPFQPFVQEKNQEWYWFRRDIKARTIYDAVKEAKMKAAGILWPVTAKATMKYNIPEVVAINDENQALKVLRNGNPLFCINMELKYGSTRQGIKQPYLDDFSTLCTIDTIKNKSPNLLLVHLIDLDDAKHRFSTESKEVDEVIVRMDKRIGDIIKAVEDTGLINDTVFIVSGDHGQFHVDYKVHLNNILRDNNLIDEKNGNIQWRAYFQTTGGSAYLYIKEGDKEARRLVIELIEKAIAEDKYGIDRLLSREELDNYNIHKSIPYMIEAKKGYSFVEELSNTTIEDLKAQGIKHATHGYLPDKDNYKSNLIISGDIIKSGYQMGKVNMVDIAPTIAKILGVEFADCEGRSLDEIFITI